MANLIFEAESYTWFALTVVVLLLRLVSRRIVLGGFKKLAVDDGLMVIAVLTDLVLIIGLNIISHSDSNLIDPEEDPELDDDEISRREFGSKMVLVVEQMQCVTIWLVKACLLIMYHRLTMSLSQNLAVKVVAVFTAVGFVAMEILYLGVWCRPFTEYWAVPPRNTQCSAATNHLITNAVLNISSDIMIILIPMPVFLLSSMSRHRKAILCGLFTVGTFTIICAILNKYYSFTQPFGSDWTFWYMRESSTALIAANLPLTWPIFQRVFNLKSFLDNSPSNRSGSNGRYTTFSSRLRSRGRSAEDEDHNLDRSRHRSIRDTLSSAIDRSESEERIYTTTVPLKIYQKREVEISTLPAGPDDTKDRLRRKSSTETLPDGLKTVVNVMGGGERSSSKSRKYDESTSEKSVGGLL